MGAWEVVKMLDLPQNRALWAWQETRDTAILMGNHQNHGIKWFISQ
jgi:hypothetical protein